MRVPLALLLALGVAACDSGDGGTDPGDTTPPSAVSDLQVTLSPLSLGWTAPGDDGNTGTAASYDVRYSTIPLSEASWGLATPVPGVPSPAAAGTAQSVDVTGLEPGTEYHFGLKATDEASNESALSNVATATTLVDTLFMEDFGGTLAPDWDCFDGDPAFSDGQFTIANEELTVSGGNNTGYKVCLALPTAGLTDYSVEASVTNQAGVDADVAGIFFRVDDVADRAYVYELVEREGILQIAVRGFGDPFGDRTLLATTFDVVAGQEYRLRVDVEGDTIRTFVDGVPYFVWTDTEFATGGIGLGVIESAAVFDDVLVTSR